MAEANNPEPNSDKIAVYFNLISLLNEPKDQENRIISSLQDVSENLETITRHPQFSSFYKTSLPTIMHYLSNGPKNFLMEHNGHLIRKLLLELVYRFPFSETRNYITSIFPVLYNSMESDNEENACVAMRIITESHKRIHPQKLNDEVKKFVQLLKKFTCIFMQNSSKILEPRNPLHARDISEVDVESILSETFTTTTVQTEKKNTDGSSICYNILPRGLYSLKLLMEIPINIIMMFQVYRNVLETEVFELLQLAVKLIALQPSPAQKSHKLFNKEIYVDFLNVQAKYLSFIAYMARSQEEKFQSLMLADKLPVSIVNLFKNCPHEVAHMRKDLLYSTRYIIGTRFRSHFAPYIEQFFDENVLIGTGWTTRETLRSFSYSIIYDLVHHLRDNIKLNELLFAINTYSKNLYDETLSLTIHIMSCRLMLNLADSYHKAAEKENILYTVGDVFFKIFEVYTNKIRAIAKFCLPAIKAKLNASNSSVSEFSVLSHNNSNKNDESTNVLNENEDRIVTKEDMKLKFGFPDSPSAVYTVNECRMLVKTLVNGLKILSSKLSEFYDRYDTNAVPSNSTNNSNMSGGQASTATQVSIKTGFCRPRDIPVLIRLFKKGLKLLEIYNVNSFPSANNVGNIALASKPNQSDQNTANNSSRTTGASGVSISQSQAPPQSQIIQRTKEEKEMMESFANIFILLSPQTFRVVMSSTIDYFVQCINENYNIQQVAHTFLSMRQTSPIFANVLVGYLVERMKIMGSNTELSNLYLKLFKLVFGSVSMFPSENEVMLKPHLRLLVNNSMEMALNAKEPYNYFLLLRALFRSIGGGSHDLLYQEFLPMLPSLLQGLNSLQSGIHRQNMKDLFVELCLTIPVRLSSLLPYLPWLMDPLVSALNGTHNLIAQGLRTLELCVDNLQPDFLYEHIQPIRTELMQSLWRTLRNPADNIAQVSFRILGKLGGSNHKQMIEPQKLEYIEFRDPTLIGDPLLSSNNVDKSTNFYGASNVSSYGSYSFISVQFSENPQMINLPIDKVIETAYRGLRFSNTESFYRHQCWEVIKGFFVAHIQHISTKEEIQSMHKLFSHSSFSTSDDFGYPNTQSSSTSSSITTTLSSISASFYKFPDEKLRKIHELALTAMFTASAIKELYNSVVPFMIPLVRHYTLVAISQQAGPIHSSGRSYKLHGMDPLVLVDAIAAVMGQEEKELCKPGHLVLRIIIDTALSVLGDKERACQLPLYEYILERLCALCYERPWYSKYGGCVALRYLFDRMSLRWLFAHQYVLIKAMLFVMMDLSGDLSSGVIDMAKDNLETIITICCAPLPNGSPKDLCENQQKSMSEVIQELLRQITSSNKIVREEAMHLLEVLAKTTGQTVTEVIQPHKDLLEEMVPPKKLKLLQQPVNVQIGILDGNTFCITLEPQLFVIDINIQEHLNFFNDLHFICDSDDAMLQKHSCYKSVTSLVPLRKSALKTLAACHYLKSARSKIFVVLYKALNSQDSDLQECAYQCMDRYKVLKDVNPELIRKSVRSFLVNISDYRSLNTNTIQLLKYLARLFTYIFNDKFCEQMLQHLIRITDSCVNYLRRHRDCELKIKAVSNNESTNLLEYSQLNSSPNVDISSHLKLSIEIINLFSEISAADETYVELLVNFLNKTENILDNYACTKFYEPIRNFLKRYPKEAIQLFERRLSEENVFRFFQFVLKGDDGASFRAILQENPSKLITLLKSSLIKQDSAVSPAQSQQSPMDVSGGIVPSSPGTNGSNLTSKTSYSRYQAIKIISILVKHDPNWLSGQNELVNILKQIWISDSFHEEHLNSFSLDYTQWNEPKLLIKCLLNYVDHNQTEFEILFQLLRAFNGKYHCDFEFLRKFLATTVMKTYSIEWKRNAFIKFAELFFREYTPYANNSYMKMSWSQEIKAKILQYIIIPAFSYSFEMNEGEQLIGGQVPLAESSTSGDGQSETSNDLVNVFLNLIVEDNLIQPSDAVRILILQLACLLVEHAPNYIKPPSSNDSRVPRNKRQDTKVRRLMTYVWPCLLTKNLQDPANKYYGHLLLTQIISKFAIHKKIVRQVFHSLLKAHCTEARPIVRNSLEILIPALPQRMDDGHRIMRQWTKKLIIEEGHMSGQLIHLLQLIVRHYKIYYPVRHVYISHMVSSIQRLGLSQSSVVEQRKLALDLVEVIIRWEHQRITEEQDKVDTREKMEVDTPSGTEPGSEDKLKTTPVKQHHPQNQQLENLSHGSIEKDYSDTVVTFLIRFICVVHDFNLTASGGPFGIMQNSALGGPHNADYLCRRALALLKNALQAELWPNTDFKIIFLERFLASAKDKSPNYTGICMALELLIAFLQTMKPETVLQIFINLQKAIAVCCTCINSKVVRTLHNLLTKMMALFPPSCASTTISPNSGAPVKVLNDQLEPLEQLYTEIHSIILNGIGAYNKANSTISSNPTTANSGSNSAVPNANQPSGNAIHPNSNSPGMVNLNRANAGTAMMINSTTSTLSQLFGTLMILKAACLNQPSYIDRLLTPFMLMLQKLVKEHIVSLQQTTDFNASLCVEIIILSLELVKNRLGAMNQETRRAFIQGVFIGLIEKSPEVKVMKTILKIFEEWIKQPLSMQHGSRASSGTMHPSIVPVLREKGQLLSKIAQNIEKRFGDDQDLNASFLELIHYIYSDDTLKSSDLSSKLESAFLAGLRCHQVHIRVKFFQILDNTIRKRLHDRLLYTICEQNWEGIGLHYWIKQCIELILAISNPSAPLSTPNSFATLPLPTTLIPLNDQQEKSLFSGFASHDIDSISCTPTDMLMDFDFIGLQSTVPPPVAGTTTAQSCDVEMADLSSPNKNSTATTTVPDAHSSSVSFINDLFSSQTSTTGPVTMTSGSATGNTAAQILTPSSNPKQNLLVIVSDFLQNLHNAKSFAFINAISQLCYLDSSLAQHVWIQLFPRVYSILNERQQLLIALEMGPFLTSGSHSIQRDAAVSSIGTFFEAISHCEPPIKMRPMILKYLSKNHNIWHRAALLLEEDMGNVNVSTPCVGLGGLIHNGASSSSISVSMPSSTKHTRGSSLGACGPGGSGGASNADWNQSGSLPTNVNDIFPAELPFHTTYSQECAHALGNIYEYLKEEDFWSGIWQKQAQYNETLIGIAYEQQGFFEQAKGAYELAMSKARNDYSNTPSPYSLRDEYCFWERHWIRCSKELNQWDFLLEYANTPDAMNPLLLLESAWRIPDWNQMNKAIVAVESNLPKDIAWKLALYKGYNIICNSNHTDLEMVDRMVEIATSFLIKDWRRLPFIVSSVHIDILHAAHQVIELQEAFHLHQSLFSNFPTSNQNVVSHERPPHVDLRAIIKTWKNRLPILADDLSHWSDIFTWRQHHYQAIVSRFESDVPNRSFANTPAGQNALLGAHASAQSLIHYAKIARKHFLTSVSLDSLNRIHTIPKVPIVDCFQKIRQQLKCYLLLHQNQPSGDELQEGLSVIESTHLKYFQREMIAEFYAMKGHFLAKLSQKDEANKNFSAATQIQDTLVKAWALWGEYFDDLFTSCESFNQRNIDYGVSAITAYMHACRHQNEAKARKFLSKVIWLLSYDKDSTLAQTTEKYNAGVPQINWLPWVPQLLQCLIRSEGSSMINIVSQVCKMYPQAVYFPIRTLYLTLKLEQREMKYKINMISSAAGINQQTNSSQQIVDQVLASSGMWRCSRIMNHQRDVNPSILTSLEGIVDQLSWFRENWYEEILRQLRQALAKCYTVAFENRTNVAETPVSMHTFNFVRKLVATFGIGIENISGGSGASNRNSNASNQMANASSNSSHSNTNASGTQQSDSRNSTSTNRPSNVTTTASESLARRAQATAQDPDFHKMKLQFTNDFDFSLQGSRKLHNLIVKLKKWIKILEAKTKVLPKSWLLEEKCRFLSNFSQKTVDVALPGEFLLPKIGCISIARFMPRVEIITKHNTAARRLYIRGHNGKIYPYLVLNDSSLSEARREERLLQLQRLLNLYLSKHKETARRLLHFTVPRVVCIAPQMRFVEDNVSSLSLIEIYKQHVIRRGSDPDAPIAKYYDRLLSVQTKGSQATVSNLREIVADIQSSMAPKTLLKEWALQTFYTATEFWHFRKQFTLQLGLAGLSEFAFHLTRLNPDMMYIHRDTGLMNISYYRFDLNEENGELVSDQPVPFRLTYSIQNLISEIGILGPLTATMISTASCLVHPNYKVRSILCAILRDEIILWHKRIKSNEKIALLSAAMSAALSAANNAANAANSGSTPADDSMSGRMDDSASSDTNTTNQQQLAQQQQQQLAAAFTATQSNEIPEISGEELVTLVTKAVKAIMSRLQSLATFEGSESKVATLISAATNQDNLCRMDPAWHPWL